MYNRCQELYYIDIFILTKFLYVSIHLFQSSFTSLNVSDDELDIEEHTRELQIEIALNLFNKALKFQIEKDYKNAFLKYNELARIEIINLNNLEISDNSIINRLKFLCCRNRGMLRLRDLIDQFNKRSSSEGKEQPKKKDLDGSEDIILLSGDEIDDDLDDDEIEISIYGEIIGSINDLLNSTLFGEPDEKIIFILSSLFKHFNYPRLARLCYELKINNLNSNDDLKINLEHPESLLSNQSNLLTDYLNLLESLNDENSYTYKSIKSTIENSKSIILNNHNKFKNYNWGNILTLKAWNNERISENDDLLLTINVNDNLVDVSSLLDSMVNCLPKPKGRSKVYDGYMLTDSITDNIIFDFELTQSENVDDVIVNDDEVVDDSKAEINGKPRENNSEVENNGITIDANKNSSDSNTDTNKDSNTDTNKDSNTDANKYANTDTNKYANTEPQKGTSTEGNQPSTTKTTRTLRTKTEPEISDQTSKIILQKFDTFISDTLPAFLKFSNIELNLKPLSNMILKKTPNDDDNEIDLNTKLFYYSIVHWNDECTQSLTISDGSNENTNHNKTKDSNDSESVRDLLNIKSSKLILFHLFEEIDTSNLYDILKTMSSKNLHFNEVRMEILEYFFNLHNGIYSIITVNAIDKKSLKNFKTVVDSVSINYYKEFSKMIYYENDFENSTDFLKKINISISIYEILVNSYLEFTIKQKLKKITSKSIQHDVNNTESTLMKRINKWNSILEDLFSIIDFSKSKILTQLWCRFEWLQLHYLQECPATINTEKLIQLLMELSKIVEVQELYIPYVNYDQISALNFDNIQTQYSRLKILEIFNTNEKSNEILESVLLNFKIENLSPKYTEIQNQFQNFLENSNLQMKLRLWSLLLRYYRVDNNITKYKLAFEKIIAIMMNEISSENNKLSSDYQLRIKILNILGFFTYFSQKFINFFNSSNFKCFDNNTLETSVSMVSSISSIVYMLYSFLMYQKAVQVDGRASMSIKSLKSFEILNNCISHAFFLLVAYYPTSMVNPNPEIINDFLSVCHVELGTRHMCTSINGVFLKLLQYKLSNIDFSISANDIFQIIHCRFGLSLSFDGFETFDHKCKPKKLTIDDSIQLSKFVSTYCFRDKHPVTSSPRNDIKNIIDKIVDVVDTTSMKDANFLSNEKIYKDYLDNTKIDLKLIIDMFNGKFQLQFHSPKVTGIKIAENGLYYLEGLIGLHFFKIRRRTIQSRASELDIVLKMFENDISFGCNRFETWVALGQTYSYLVEDDLMWTADKLNSFERKQSTSLTQKKALLCYLMAISIYFNSDANEKLRCKPVLLSLWESFAKELYCSWMEPLNKKAFHIAIKENTDKPTNTNQKSIIEYKYQPNNIPTNAILKLLELAFNSAMKYDDSNWCDIMYLAKSQYKLQYQDINHDKIINELLASCKLALLQSNKEDPIIEPHYYLFSMIRKFYKNSKISIDEAIEYLKKDQLFEEIFTKENKDENVNEDNTNGADQLKQEITFDKLTFQVLRKIISYDKKNWQHRPVYTLAKAYYDIDHDVAGAKEEMLALINLKPNVRSLSTIWKPSSERPGKHFIYNSMYTQFIVQLLYENGDIYSLTILLKKMRRAGSIMVNLTKTFDDMMRRICTLIKKSLALEPNFLDETLLKIKFADFIKYSAEFITNIKESKDFDDYTQLHFFFLSETQAFRKLATGFGATGIIDECYHSIYIKLFLPFLLKRLIEDRGNGMTISELLEQSKNFSVDKLAKLKQTTPEVSTQNDEKNSPNQAVETGMIDSLPDEIHMKDNEVDKNNLTWKDQCAIIGFLTFGLNVISGTPNKEKTKTARRDVSPFAVKVVHLTFNAMETLRKNTSDGETINYHIVGPLDNTEFERTIAGVNAKETKENKEDKEFEKLISVHDRSFDDNELKEFNEILSRFDIVQLTSYTTKSEIAKLEKAELEKKKQLETQLELERLRKTIRGNTPVTEVSTQWILVNPAENSNSSIDKPDETTKPPKTGQKSLAVSTPIFERTANNFNLQTNNSDPFISPKKLQVEFLDAEISNTAGSEINKQLDVFTEKRTEATNNDSDKMVPNLENRINSKKTMSTSATSVESTLEPNEKIPSPLSKIKSPSPTTTTESLVGSAHENPSKKEMADAKPENLVSTANICSSKTTTPTKNEQATLVHTPIDDPDKMNKSNTIVSGSKKNFANNTPSKQSKITNFFKKSPIKTEISPLKSKTDANKNDNKRKFQLEPESNDSSQEFENFKKIKFDDKSDYSIYKEPPPTVLNKERNLKSKNALSNEPERRNSRRSMSNKTAFFELGQTGHITEQVDIKQRREKLLIENAEVLSSSDSDDNIIVID